MKRMYKRPLVQLIIGWMAWLSCVGGVGVSTAHGQSLVVVVQREDGRLLPGASVTLRNARDRALRPKSSKGGYFIFEQVPEAYNVLQVKAAGMQLNGCQWLVYLPDTIHMVMRPGPYYTVQEGSREARLVFDWSRLELDYADGVVENDLRPFMAELGLTCGPHSCTHLRRPNGGRFPMHHCEELATLRQHPAVVSAGVYADHAKRSLHEWEGVTPTAGSSMFVQHQFTGIITVQFYGYRMEEETAFGKALEIGLVLRQFGFAPAELPADAPYEALVSEAFGWQGIALKPISGLNGPLLIGQIAQLAAHPAVGKVELVYSDWLD
jgi:hypothetical protein